MNKLRTTSQFLDPDAAYFALLEAHHGLSDEQSAQLNACLVLILPTTSATGKSSTRL